MGKTLGNMLSKVAETVARKRAAMLSKQDPVMPKRDPLGPVPEQARYFGQKPENAKTERGQIIGRAYRRHPHFETMIAKDWSEAQRDKRAPAYSADALRALKLYRATFEDQARSETKSALDIRPRGSGERVVHDSPRTAFARARLAHMDADIGAVVDTLRAVALYDMTFTELAMQRFGSRNRQRIVIGKKGQEPRIINEIVPRSGRHRDIIRDEFMLGLARLMASRAVMHAAA